jgi:hypothetical protein
VCPAEVRYDLHYRRCRTESMSYAAGLCDSADPASEPGWNVGFREDGMIIFAKFTWPSVFIQQRRDEKQTRSDLTSPLVPEEFKKCHVVMNVDCFGTIYGIENIQNKCSKGDQSASIFTIFIRAAYPIAICTHST